jgi:hypothetical protein
MKLHHHLETFSAFEDFLVEKNIHITKYDKEQLHGRGRQSYLARDKVKTKDEKDCLFVEWITGGMTGGSCWHDEGATRARDAEMEPELEDLDKIITSIYPRIPYLEYKKIEKLIQRGERTEREYYGNYTEYAYKFIPITDLYQFLVDAWMGEDE